MEPNDTPQEEASPPPLPQPSSRAGPPATLRTPTARLLDCLARRNPAYLVSAVLMILGVYSIVQPGSQAIGNIPAILATFSTLQFYELLLVGIAVLLVCRLRVMDDGATLVLIEALFAIGCFVVADELAFKDNYRSLGLALGLIATALAAGRLGALGAAAGRGLPLSSMGVFLAFLLLWNGASPAWVAGLHDADSQLTDAASLVGWWVLAIVAFGLAVRATWEVWPLRRAGEPFVKSRLAHWTIAGIVVATTALHQYWVGYILDAPALIADLLPLATVLAFGVLGLFIVARLRESPWEHVAVAVPGVLCLVALVTGSFEPLVRTAGTVPLRHAFVHELRSLTWPTAWLAIAAALAALHAWRRRSPGLAHQAAALLALVALFSRAKSPEDLNPNIDALLLALTAWFGLAAATARSPRWMAAALATADLFLLRQWPAKAAAGLYASPGIGALALMGLSRWALWLTFRDRVPRWVAHVGAVFLVEAAIGLNFAPTTKAPGWLLAIWTLGTAAGLAAMGRKFHWWAYYLLAVGTFLLTPVRELGAAEQAVGSPAGWILVLGAFVALGLGFLVSLRKSAAPPLPIHPSTHRGELQ